MRVCVCVFIYIDIHLGLILFGFMAYQPLLVI